MNTIQQKHLYIFSGLGADERVLQHLDFSAYTTTFIKWSVPLPDEPIERYASRLCAQITTERPILIGLSFGGIMAQEVARQIATEKIILLASAKTRYEIPFYFRIAGQWRLHKLVPASLLKQGNVFMYWLFGAKTKNDQVLLQQILRDTDPVFLKWAIDKIVRWENKNVPQNIVHIHGTNDKILPAFFLKNSILISGGTHWMTMDKVAVLNPLLRHYINSSV